MGGRLPLCCDWRRCQPASSYRATCMRALLAALPRAEVARLTRLGLFLKALPLLRVAGHWR